MDQSNLLSLLYAENAEISAYRERNFGCLHLIQPHYSCANTYNHIKQKTRNYLMFDIDNIQIDKVNFLFNNDSSHQTFTSMNTAKIKNVIHYKYSYY